MILGIANMAAWTWAGALLIVVKFSDTVQLGSILATVFVLIIAGLFTIRAKNAEWWKASYEGLKAAHDEKARELKEAALELADAKSRIVILESLPTYESIAALMTKAMDHQAREHVEIISALGTITSVLRGIEDDLSNR